jgi:predicted membrane-bound mannosyltransferase
MKNIINKIKFDDLFFFYFAIALLCAVIYIKTAAFGFTFFDDSELILRQSGFYSNPKNIFKIFSYNIIPYESFYYRPLLTLSFFIDYIISGNSPAMFHLTNVVLHIACVCVLFALLKKFLSQKASIAFALLFAAHPVLVQAVAWVPGRNDSLLALFTFSAFLFFLKWLQTSAVKQFLLFNLFFAFAMFTKETAAVLPLMCVIFTLLFDKPKKVLYFLPPMLLIFTAFVLLKTHYMHGVLAENTVSNIIKTSPYVLHYFGKIFLPVYLSPIQTLKDYPPLPSVVVTAAFTACCFIFKIRKVKLFIFGILWFVLFSLPALSLLGNAMLEHRVYVPMLGIILAVSCFDVPFLGRLSKNAKTLLYGCVLLWFSVTSFIYADNFIDPVRFWEKAEKTSPTNATVQIMLAKVYYYALEDFQKAKVHAEKAAQLRPIKENIDFLNLTEETLAKGV